MKTSRIVKHVLRAAQVGVLGFVATLVLVPTVKAQNQGCVVTRAEVLRDVQRGLDEINLFEKYAGCQAAETQDNLIEPLDITNPVAKSYTSLIKPVVKNHKQVITNTGSTYYEALTSCGYHPQRKELTCPIEIRQRFGFGGPPAIQPAGSFEYVLFCVDTGFGLQPVNVNGVHVHNEAFGVPPNWYLSAVVAADGKRQPNLFSQPLDGRTLRARAILSWNINPFRKCNFQPIWGNQADFHIRLDP